MTQEQKRIKIAEARGWKFRQTFLGDFYGNAPNSHKETHDPAHWNRDLYELPKYFSDLNDCHDMEKGVCGDSHLWDLYCENLLKVCSQGHPFRENNIVGATAAQRAEAFGKTLNLW